MSKYKDNFCSQFATVGDLKRITKEMKEAKIKEAVQKETEINFRNVIKGYLRGKGRYKK